MRAVYTHSGMIDFYAVFYGYFLKKNILG